MGVAQLHESGGLVACAGINRTSQVGGIVGDQPHGAAFNTDQGRDQAWRELPAQFQNAVLIGQGFDDLADIVDPHSVFRNQVAEPSLIGALPVLPAALEVRQVLLRNANSFGFILDQDINHPVGRHDGSRPYLFRSEAPKAAAFDHRGPGHTQIGVFGGNDGVAAAKQRRVARIATAGHNT